ncbi:MAG: hypothetical protein ACR2NW_07750, partial [Thermodesulfobacteriota bacterium]
SDVECVATLGESPPAEPPEPPPEPIKNEGTYAGTGSCDIGIMNLTLDGNNIVIDQIGSTSNVTLTPSQFDMDGNPTEWMSPSNLVLFGIQNHTCFLTCNPPTGITVMCTNAQGGSCTELLTLQ